MGEPFQRLGLIGDVHCEDDYLAVAIKHLQQLGAEALLCVGDLADGRGDLNRVCALLQENRVLTVRGNHDRWLLDGEARDWPEAVQLDQVNDETIAFLRALPTSLPVNTVAGKLLLCHGMGDNDWGRLEPDYAVETLKINLDFWRIYRRADLSFVVAGHTHMPMVRRFARPSGNALTVINIGQLKYSHNPMFVLADFALGELQFFDIGLDNIVRAGRLFRFNDVLLETIP